MMDAVIADPAVQRYVTLIYEIVLSLDLIFRSPHRGDIAIAIMVATETATDGMTAR